MGGPLLMGGGGVPRWDILQVVGYQWVAEACLPNFNGLWTQMRELPTFPVLCSPVV